MRQPTPDGPSPTAAPVLGGLKGSIRLLAVPLVVAPLAVAVISACASSTGSADRYRITDSQRLYLRSPLEAWPDSTTPEAFELGAAFDSFLGGGSTAAARVAASQALRSAADFKPAAVLLAQADFVDGRLESVRSGLGEWIAEYPRYAPAVLLWGRASELDGDLPVAYEAYRSLADRLPLAAQRAEELEEGATLDVLTALEEALRGNRIGVAEDLVARLDAWSAGSPAALRSQWLLSRATGDAEAELGTLRRLTMLPAGSDEALERRAELELSHGDAQVALRLFERLAAEDPENPERAENLTRARFRWRLLLLPEEIVGITESAQLTRTEFASLLFWLIPGVRNAAVSSGRIATDILEVPARRRQEIARVVNRGLMEVDTTMHRFDPLRAVSRREALTGLLAALAQTRPAPSCVREFSPNPSPSLDLVCRSATLCRILDDISSCLPEAPINGEDAREMFRRTLTALPEN